MRFSLLNSPIFWYGKPCSFINLKADVVFKYTIFKLEAAHQITSVSLAQVKAIFFVWNQQGRDFVYSDAAVVCLRACRECIVEFI